MEIWYHVLNKWLFISQKPELTFLARRRLTIYYGRLHYWIVVNAFDLDFSICPESWEGPRAALGHFTPRMYPRTNELINDNSFWAQLRWDSFSLPIVARTMISRLQTILPHDDDIAQGLHQYCQANAGKTFLFFSSFKRDDMRFEKKASERALFFVRSIIRMSDYANLQLESFLISSSHSTSIVWMTFP